MVMIKHDNRRILYGKKTIVLTIIVYKTAVISALSRQKLHSTNATLSARISNALL